MTEIITSISQTDYGGVAAGIGFLPSIPTLGETDGQEPTPLPPSSITGTITQGQIRDVVDAFLMPNYTQSIVEQLSFLETIGFVYQHVMNQGGVQETLQMSQLVQYSLTKSPYNQTVQDSITVADSITESRQKSKNDSIGVAQTIVANRSSVKNVTDSLTMTQHVNAYKNTYHWIDPGISDPESTSTFTLSWSGTTVTLRNPKFGDADKYEATRINRLTKGGDLQIFRDPMWPDQEILSVEFEYLNSTQAADLLDFIHNSLGQKITVIDQYNVTWHGYIITPEAEVIQNKRIGYGAKFDFQGTQS